ncbi:hypothetical protein AB0J48_15285 [Nocardia salmonicida]|uniref:hypothetical protein n=1 Tax=Nocardia salmonicida TaxID=53431 RepID=UPI0034194820
MTDLLTRGQLDLLAHLLAARPEDLAGFARLGAADLRAVRERISDNLFDADAPMFARIAKLAPLLPDVVVAKVAVSVVPAEVSGRAAGALAVAHPDRIAGILTGLPVSYLADAAAHMDPRTIPELAARVPAAALVPAAEELLRRGDFTTTSRFVEHAPDELVAALERGIGDDLGLLMTAALIPDDGRLTAVLRSFPAERRDAIARTAATGGHGGLIAAISVYGRLEADLRASSTAVLVGAMDEAAVIGLVEAAAVAEAGAELLAAVAGAEDDLLRRVADAIAASAADTVTALVVPLDTTGRASLRALWALRTEADGPEPTAIAGI